MEVLLLHTSRLVLELLGSLLDCPWFIKWPYFFCGTCLCVLIWCQVTWLYSELPWSSDHVELMMVQTQFHETATWVQTSWRALTPVLEKTVFSLVLEIGKVEQWKDTACFPIFSSYARSVTMERFFAVGNIWKCWSKLFHKSTPIICVYLTHFLTFLFCLIQ